MAQRSTEQQRKEELIATLAASRESLRTDRSEIKRRLNPVTRIRTVVRDKPIPVFATTAGIALLLSLLLRRRKEEPKPFNAKRMILGWALSLAKPAARVWLATWAKDRFLPLSPPPPPSDPAHTP